MVKEAKYKKCAVCPNEFQIRNSLDKYCSPACAYMQKKPKEALKTKKCRECKGGFQPYTTLDKYCSPKCKMIANPIKKEKKVQTKSQKLFSKAKKKLKKLVIKRYGRLQCEKCGKGQGELYLPLQTHHIVYQGERQYHPMLHDLLNLILLCDTCHSWFHAVKSRRNYLVKKRKLKDLFGNLYE